MKGISAAGLGKVGVVVAIVFWSTGNIIVRQTPMDAAQIAFWRTLAAGILYWVALLMVGRRLTFAQVRASALAGIAIGIELWLFFSAIKLTNVANATIIGALQPLLVMAFGLRRFGERVTMWLVGSALFAIAGVALVVYGGESGISVRGRGDALALVSTFFFAGYFIYAKQARLVVPALEFQASIWLVSAVVLAPVAIVDAGGFVLPTTEQWLWLGLLLAIPTTGHLIMNWAHGRVHLSVTSMATLAIPVLSAIAAVLFLDEQLRQIQVVGMTVVIATLVYVIRRDARDPVPSQ